MRSIALLAILCIGSSVFSAPGNLETKDGQIIATDGMDLGKAGPPKEKVEKRMVRVSFAHSDHGFGFGKLLWDGKRKIQLKASIRAQERFSVYPFSVRIRLVDPAGKQVRNESLSIGFTWQNYEWSGPSLWQSWDPGLAGAQLIEQKRLDELSQQPFGTWRIIFSKDMNFTDNNSGEWKWETLAEYPFEVFDGRNGATPPWASASSDPCPEKGTEVVVSPLFANEPVLINGVRISFKKYDMQRYRENDAWKWTINFCEVFADNALVAKLCSEEMEEGEGLTKMVATASGKRAVTLKLKKLPKVTAMMECRGPDPCFPKDHPVTRASQMTLLIDVK